MSDVLKLFPTIIYASQILFEKSELDFVKSLEYEFFDNGTYHEKGIKDRFVLEETPLSNFKIKLQKELNHYANEILKYKNKFRITNSWLNFNPKGSFHSKHTHSNSIISGVYYIDVPKDAPGITFYNPKNPEIFIECDEWNEFNSVSWNINVKSNTLLLFSSNIYHEVSISHSNENRFTLAFNSFPYGEIGYHTNRLVIK